MAKRKIGPCRLRYSAANVSSSPDKANSHVALRHLRCGSRFPAAGTVFKLTQSNGSWTYTSLHDFTGGTDGGYPVGDVSLDTSGNAVVATVPLEFPNVCGHHPDGTRAYVTNLLKEVSVIDTATNLVVSRVPVNGGTLSIGITHLH